MLWTQTYTPADAIMTIDDRVADLEGDQDPLDENTDEYAALAARIDRLQYFRNGLEWARDEWGDGVEIELGAVTAGEKAMMHREAPDEAGPEEMRLWFVAASTEQAPYAGDSLEETFQGVAQCHPAFVEWAEAETNGLFAAGGETGNANQSST